MSFIAALRSLRPHLAWLAGVAAFALITAPGLADAAPTERCENMAGLQLPDTTISRVELVAGAGDLPAHCRVVAAVKASPDSDIEVEVWLPVERWTGVFHGVGNGGYAGSVKSGYPGMAAGLRRGYATATTDMGTAPASVLDGDALVGHPQKWKDWGLLSTHVMTVTGKAIAKAFYGERCPTGLLHGLLHGRSAGPDRGAALSRRL